METEENKIGWIIWLFIVPFLSFSQPSNVGGLYISPGEQFSTLAPLDNSAQGIIENNGELFVYNHFKNEGLVKFSPNTTTSTMRFHGQTGFQDLEGSGTTKLYNVEFNNDKTQYSFHLKSNVDIYGQADFQHGIVDNANYAGTLTFENNSTVENVDNNSHVNGSVIKKGSSAFIFPIGNGANYRLASISAPSTVLDRYSARYHFNNPDGNYSLANKAYGIQEIDNTEYWEINKLGGDGPVILTLSWDTVTSPDFITTNSEAIFIVRWDPLKNSWEYMDSTVDLVKKEVTAVLPISDYGIFTLAIVDKEVVEEYKFPKGLSPNGDGINDFLQLEFLDGNPRNTVSIFNRW